MSIDVPTLSRATQCNTIINPTALGYDNTVDGNNLNLKVDVYTLFSSLTVANLLNGPNTLRNYLTIDLFVEFNYFGVEYQVYRKFDRYELYISDSFNHVRYKSLMCCTKILQI